MILLFRLGLVGSSMYLIDAPWAYVLGGMLIVVSVIAAFMKGMSG